MGTADAGPRAEADKDNANVVDLSAYSWSRFQFQIMYESQDIALFTGSTIVLLILDQIRNRLRRGNGINAQRFTSFRPVYTQMGESPTGRNVAPRPRRIGTVCYSDRHSGDKRPKNYKQPR
jgi:hypothetical protein